MSKPDLMTAVIVGAMVGLLFFALGYAQLVWFTRHRKVTGQGAGSTRTRWPVWALLVLAGMFLLRSLVSSSLADRTGFLFGEELLSARARPGLVAQFEPTGAEVHANQVLIHFSGVDGEDPQLALQSRLAQLEAQLEIERARPVDLDPELVRRVDVARAALQDRERSAQQLTADRDSLTREQQQRQLDLAGRRFQLEKDDHATELELSPLLARLATEESAAKTDQLLAVQGNLPKLEAARSHDELETLKRRIAELQDQRGSLQREKQQLEQLRLASEHTVAVQLDERSGDLKTEAARLESARAELAKAEAALEGDRPRARALREKQLRQIQIQIDESRALLEGHGRELTFRAPWDGLIGFREPSPSSAPGDNGPLLVLYQPGSISTRVRLAPGEPVESLRAEIDLVSSAPDLAAVIPKEPLPGRIVQRTDLPDGSTELRVACDPPDRVVRLLAMGGTLPVSVHLHSPLTHTASFWIGIGCIGLSVALALFNLVRRRPRKEPLAEPPSAPSPAPVGPSRIEVLGGALQMAGNLKALLPGAQLAAGPALQISSGEDFGLDDVLMLRELGARLRSQVEGGAIASGLVHELAQALETGGYPAAALVSVGYGNLTDPGPIERAAFSLLATDRAVSNESLIGATRDCARFMRIVRVLSSKEMSSSLERIRRSLISATVEVARRTDPSTGIHVVGNVVAPLMEES